MLRIAVPVPQKHRSAATKPAALNTFSDHRSSKATSRFCPDDQIFFQWVAGRHTVHTFNNSRTHSSCVPTGTFAPVVSE